MFSKFKIEKSHYSTNTMQRMPQWHKLDFKASGKMKVESFKQKKVRKSYLKFLLYVSRGWSSKTNLKQKRAHSVYIKTDIASGQLLAIACSQELNMKEIKLWLKIEA